MSLSQVAASEVQHVREIEATRIATTSGSDQPARSARTAQAFIKQAHAT